MSFEFCEVSWAVRDSVRQVLKEKSEDGWEIKAAFVDGDYIRVYLQRPKP